MRGMPSRIRIADRMASTYTAMNESRGGAHEILGRAEPRDQSAENDNDDRGDHEKRAPRDALACVGLQPVRQCPFRRERGGQRHYNGSGCCQRPAMSFAGGSRRIVYD
jgi:hypothetical protein